MVVDGIDVGVMDEIGSDMVVAKEICDGSCVAI
jgi:hypothetical protein